MPIGPVAAGVPSDTNASGTARQAMPRTVAPRTATRIVLNRVSHLSVATIPAIGGGPAEATGGTLLGLRVRVVGRDQRKVLPHLRA